MEQKIREKKTVKAINKIFASAIKILLANFLNHFRNVTTTSSGNLSRDHYWGGDIREIHDLEVFLDYISKSDISWQKFFWYEDFSEFL